MRRQKPKRTINRATQDPEVALVKRQRVERVVAVRQHDDVGCVGETYTQAVVSLHYVPCRVQVSPLELRQRVRINNFFEQGESGVVTHPCSQ